MFKVVGFISIVALLFWVFFSLLAGIGVLLFLKYNHVKDSHFLRSFYNLHYKGLIIIASIATLTLSIAQNYLIAIAALTLVAIGTFAFYFIVGNMDKLNENSVVSNNGAIRKFKQLNKTGLAVSLFCLVSVVWVVSQSSLFNCTQIPPGCIPGQQIAGQTEPCKNICSLF